MSRVIAAETAARTPPNGWTLNALMRVVAAERVAVRRARVTLPHVPANEQIARLRLIRALEEFEASLRRSNFPVPRRVQDELWTQRALHRAARTYH